VLSSLREPVTCLPPQVMHSIRHSLLVTRLGAPALWRTQTAGLRQVCSSTKPAPVGLGVCSVDGECDGLSRTKLFKAMMSKIDQPQRFSEVSQVSVRAAVGAAAEEGALWRSMLCADEGTVVEHVYASPAESEIRFVRLKSDNKTEGALEVVNALCRVPLRVEYFQRNRLTRERVHWSAASDTAVNAIRATLELARAAEEQAMDCDDFGSKA
jgi:hypothetical protein